MCCGGGSRSRRAWTCGAWPLPGGLVAWAAPLAAALDAVENVALSGGARRSTVDQPWPGIAFGFASVKFALLAVVIVYLVVGLLLTLDRGVSSEDSPAGS